MMFLDWSTLLLIRVMTRCLLETVETAGKLARVGDMGDDEFDVRFYEICGDPGTGFGESGHEVGNIPFPLKGTAGNGHDKVVKHNKKTSRKVPTGDKDNVAACTSNLKWTAKKPHSMLS